MSNLTLSQESSSQQPNHWLGIKVIGGLVISYGIYLVLYIIWGLFFTSFRRWLNLPLIIDAILFAIMMGGLAVIAIIIYTITTHKTLDQSLIEISFKRAEKLWLDLLFGIFIAMVVIGISFIVANSLGWLRVEYWVWGREAADILLNIILRSLAMNIMVGVLEELIFRGYVLTGLKEAWGERRGLIVMSILFIPIHFGAITAAFSLYNSVDIILLYCVQIFIFAYLTGYAYLRTGALWLPIGLHFAFNLFLDDLFNLWGYNTNPYIFGAMTYLAVPIWVIGVIEILALIIIAVSVWYWIQLLHRNNEIS